MASTMRDASTQTSDLKQAETEAPRTDQTELEIAVPATAEDGLSRKERRLKFWGPIRDKISSKREQRSSNNDELAVTSPSISTKTNPPSHRQDCQPRSNNTSRRGGRRGGGRVGHGYNHGNREALQGSSLPFEAHMQDRFRVLAQYNPDYACHPQTSEYHDLISQQMWLYSLGHPTQQARRFGWQQQVSQFAFRAGNHPIPKASGTQATQEVPLIVFSSHPDSQDLHNETAGNGQKLGGLTVSADHDLDLLAVASRTPRIVPEGGWELDDAELEAECSAIDAVIPNPIIPDPESSNLVPRGEEVDWDGQTKVAHCLHEGHIETEVLLRKEDVLASDEALVQRMALVKQLVAAGEFALVSGLRSQSLSPTSDDLSFSFTDDSTVVDEPQELPQELSANEALLHGQRLHIARKIGFDSPFVPRSSSEDWLPSS